MQLKLNDLLRFSQEQIGHAKISLNISHGKGGTRYFEMWKGDAHEPAEKDVWYAYPSHFGKRRCFYEGEICVGFLQMERNNEWILVAVGKVLSVPSSGPCTYEPLHSYDAFLGRVIVRLSKGNTMGRFVFHLSKFLDDCEVIKVCEKAYEEDTAFSLDSISLNYAELKATLDGLKNPSLRKILENIKGVYCLTDTKTGKLYIGSATGDGRGVAQRWGDYALTCSGGNKELKSLLEEKVETYFQENFKFTVIEYFGMRFDNEKILQREKYWKEVFDTVRHGYNDNY